MIFFLILLTHDDFMDRRGRYSKLMRDRGGSKGGHSPKISLSIIRESDISLSDSCWQNDK